MKHHIITLKGNRYKLTGNVVCAVNQCAGEVPNDTKILFTNEQDDTEFIALTKDILSELVPQVKKAYPELFV